ncbi:hypothetical protein U472_11565 [Orenia metallireducens]|uniref:Flagellar operon protein TIGR03826 n=2 Tax=Orenia metallireducens TaxID=1413210 RepID=A0A1C0A927_9FIRM|nr:hypothetical protein U472_11565 [Orenia metallireducens]
MKLKNCKKCNHIFVNNGQNLCPDCIEEERNNFQKIRDYLWDNPGSNINDIHQETEVPLKIIRQFLREGRFKFI